MPMFDKTLKVFDEKTTVAKSLPSNLCESSSKCVKYIENKIQKLLRSQYI